MSSGKGVLGPALAAVAILGLALFAFRGRLGLGAAAGPELTLEERLAADDRIGYLIHPCGFTLPYASDTSDTTRLLAELLAKGQRDPMKRAKGELAQLGESALPDLERRFDASYGQVFEHGIVENVLGVCTNMAGPWGLELLRRGAQHPKESVRLAAMEGLRKHGGPEDYDLVAGSIPLASSGSTRGDVARCMLDLDPERFCADYATWLEQREWEDSWKIFTPLAAAPTLAATVARYKDLAATVDIELEPFLLAAPARDGDAEARAKLDGWLRDDNPMLRGMALAAYARVGELERVNAVLGSDHDRMLRMRAAEILAGVEPSEQIDGWLGDGLADPSETVRAVCMHALAARGDEFAIARAIEMLKQDAGARKVAMRALRPAFEVAPETRGRALELLLRLVEERAQSAERASLMQAIGQVPERAAADFLLGVARSFEGEIAGLPAHRWCTHQIINTGRVGAELMLEALATESDPFRRLDLIAAITGVAPDQLPAEDTRAALKGILDDPQTSPYERVLAAQRLVQVGPSADVAPFLKRVYLANTNRIARPALHCLMWVWYG